MSDEKPTLSDITERYIRDRDAGAWCRSQEARSFMELLEKNAARERERILSEVPVMSDENACVHRDMVDAFSYAMSFPCLIIGIDPAHGPDRSVTLSVSAPGGRLDTLQIGMEADILTPDHNWRELYSAEVQHAGRWFAKCVALQAQVTDRDREITALRAQRDFWKGLHDVLVAKFSAAVPDPKPAPGHNPFREFGGDRRRGGG